MGWSCPIAVVDISTAETAQQTFTTEDTKEHKGITHHLGKSCVAPREITKILPRMKRGSARISVPNLTTDFTDDTDLNRVIARDRVIGKPKSASENQQLLTMDEH